MSNTTTITSAQTNSAAPNFIDQGGAGGYDGLTQVTNGLYVLDMGDVPLGASRIGTSIDLTNRGSGELTGSLWGQNSDTGFYFDMPGSVHLGAGQGQGVWIEAETNTLGAHAAAFHLNGSHPMTLIVFDHVVGS